jgi:hypothetical protein
MTSLRAEEDLTPSSMMVENIAAAQINLALDEVVELEAAVPPAEVAGDRYTMASMKAVDR